MKYTTLGRTGLRVSSLALGTMTFGTAWGIGADEDDSRRIFDAYADLGGNFVDTANNYTDGESERMLGGFPHEVLHGDWTRWRSVPGAILDDRIRLSTMPPARLPCGGR